MSHKNSAETSRRNVVVPCAVRYWPKRDIPAYTRVMLYVKCDFIRLSRIIDNLRESSWIDLEGGTNGRNHHQFYPLYHMALAPSKLKLQIPVIFTQPFFCLVQPESRIIPGS